MSPSFKTGKPSFVVATPARSVCDDNARALANHGLLRFYAQGTRRGTEGIPAELTRLNPAIGLAAYAAARTLSISAAEGFRFRLHPWFDRWVKRQLLPGDHLISSYGFVNDCFRWVRQNGGKTLLDGGNSHPENLWSILTEEHRRWNCARPPFARHHYERAVAMMAHVDYVLSPSNFVSRSFLERGFRPEQILKNVYPLDLACFQPPRRPRPKDRPLTIIAPGSLSLRKGTPYLLEAVRLVAKKEPATRLVLNRAIAADVQPVFSKYTDLNFDWQPHLTPSQLAEKMRGSDLLVLPSLEDGFARTVTEGLACGLPVITTPNTGASDVVAPGRSGEIVPIRDPAAIAEAVLKWWEQVRGADWQLRSLIDRELLSFEHFERLFLDQLRALGLAPEN